MIGTNEWIEKLAHCTVCLSCGTLRRHLEVPDLQTPRVPRERIIAKTDTTNTYLLRIGKQRTATSSLGHLGDSLPDYRLQPGSIRCPGTETRGSFGPPLLYSIYSLPSLCSGSWPWPIFSMLDTLALRLVALQEYFGSILP